MASWDTVVVSNSMRTHNIRMEWVNIMACLWYVEFLNLIFGMNLGVTEGGIGLMRSERSRFDNV